MPSNNNTTITHVLSHCTRPLLLLYCAHIVSSYTFPHFEAMSNASNGNTSRLPLHNQGAKNSALSFRHGLVCMMLMLGSFYCGLILGHQSSDSECQECLRDHSSVQRSIEKAKTSMMNAFQKDQNAIQSVKADIINAIVKNKVDQKSLLQSIDDHKDLDTLKDDLLEAIRKIQATAPQTSSNDDKKQTLLIPHGMNKLFAGTARVDRDEFFQRFDTGVPKDETMDGNSEVLLLYSDANALPDNAIPDDMPLLSVDTATQYCHTLKSVMLEPFRRNECLALVGQWESYHVHKFMRLPEDGDKGGLSPSNPLRHVSRLHIDSGLAQRIPTPEKVKEYNAMLVKYLSSLDKVLDELKPIAKKVSKNNTIVVMVCNHGQSELLMNFVCSSRARGFDLSQVLVFATDLETKELAEGLGLATFYDHTNFESLPKEAAEYYADDTFMGMMMGKVYSAHMISQLGYDLLFQDVDVLWYRNPLGFLSNSTYQGFDILVQDDGARNIRFQPYSPNSGFYFVRHNLRTEYFFDSLLMAGPIITQSGSHQNAFAHVMQEHSSGRGLHVKTLNRNMIEFPNGYHFQKKPEYMKDILKGKSQPVIFHMSWTANKEEKRNYFEQMGDWYVKDDCVGNTASKILNMTSKTVKTKTDLAGACCNAKPEIKCHYRDKPSKIPCKDSPPLDKGGASWW